MPNISDVNKWNSYQFNSIDQDNNEYLVRLDEADSVPEFYRVAFLKYDSESGQITNKPSKTFYGESAWSDIQREVRDFTKVIGFSFDDFTI